MSARCLAACLAVALVAAGARASGPERGPGPAPELQAYTGVWVRSERERDDLARAAEIERATAGLPLLVRGIARLVMRRSMRPPERYVIRADGEGLRIESDGSAAAAFRPGPEPSEVVREDATVSTRIAPDGLEEKWRHGEDTHGATRWRLLPGQQALAVEQEVHDRRVGAPLGYRTTYRREGTAGP